MISGEKILVTGGAGRVAFPIARELAKRNEVWGMARFSNPADPQRLKAHGITPIKRDLAGELRGRPRRLHLRLARRGAGRRGRRARLALRLRGQRPSHGPSNEALPAV